MKTKVWLFLLLFLALAFGEFYETIDIQVLDEIGRPVWDADVSIKYQLNAIQGYTETTPRKTDENGLVSIKIINTETTPARTKYDFTIIASYGKESTQAKYDVKGPRPNIISVQLRVYRLTVRVVDQFETPLSAIVSVGEFVTPTDGQGYARLIVPYGNADIIADYKGTEKKINLDIIADATRKLTISLYDLTVRVFDDQGNPLSATVEYGGEGKGTDENGATSFVETPVSEGTLKVTYKKYEREREVNLETTSEETVVFDFTPPSISDVSVDLVDGVGRITATVTDKGAYPSGFDETTRIFIRYKVNMTEKEKDMYTIGLNRYRVDIPAQEGNTLVLFTIFVSDKEGNRNSISGNYVVPPEKAPEEEENGEVIVVAPPGEGGIATIFGIEINIIVIVVLVAIIIGAVIIFLKKRAEEY